VALLRVYNFDEARDTVFCANVSYWRVCVDRKSAIITLHPGFAIPDALHATYRVLLYMMTSFQNQSCDVRDLTTVRRQSISTCS